MNRIETHVVIQSYWNISAADWVGKGVSDIFPDIRIRNLLSFLPLAQNLHQGLSSYCRNNATNRHRDSEVSTENRNPSEKMTYMQQCHTLISHNEKMEDAGCTLMTGNHSHRVNHPNANSWQFESPPALAFSKIACQVYIITIVPCSDVTQLGDVIRGEKFPKFRFSIPTLCACKAQYLCNGWTEFNEKFTPWGYNRGDSNYDARIDAQDPNPDNTIWLIK